jgi:hypothetical protein
MDIDVIKLYKECKEEGRSDEEILDYVEYLESIDNCNKAMEGLE